MNATSTAFSLSVLALVAATAWIPDARAEPFPIPCGKTGGCVPPPKPTCDDACEEDRQRRREDRQREREREEAEEAAELAREQQEEAEEEHRERDREILELVEEGKEAQQRGRCADADENYGEALKTNLTTEWREYVESLQRSCYGVNPLSPAQAIVISVCANDFDLRGACWQQSLEEAKKHLVYMFGMATAKAYVTRYLKIIFPDEVGRIETRNKLEDIEEKAIKLAEARMANDVAALEPFQWDPPDVRAWKEDVARQTRKRVAKWSDAARDEASDGTNWSHDWSTHTHTYTTGHAYQQLGNIGLTGNWGN